MRKNKFLIWTIVLLFPILTYGVSVNEELSSTGRLVGDTPTEISNQLKAKEEAIQLDNARIDSVRDGEGTWALDKIYGKKLIKNGLFLIPQGVWSDPMRNNELVIHDTASDTDRDVEIPKGFNKQRRDEFIEQGGLFFTDLPYGGRVHPNQEYFLEPVFHKHPSIVPLHEGMGNFGDYIPCAISKSTNLGEIMMNARNNYYRESGNYYIGLRLQSFQLYGNPHLKIKYPQHDKNEVTKICYDQTVNYDKMKMSAKALSSDEMLMNDYSLSDISEGKQILELPNSHQRQETYRPVLPIINYEIELPPNSIITKLNHPVFEDPIKLTIPGLTEWNDGYEPANCYFNEEPVEYSYSHITTKDKETIIAKITPVAINNCATGEVTLYRKIRFSLDSQSDYSIMIKNVNAPNEVKPEENFDIITAIENPLDEEGKIILSKDNKEIEKKDIINGQATYTFSTSAPGKESTHQYTLKIMKGEEVKLSKSIPITVINLKAQQSIEYAKGIAEVIIDMTVTEALPVKIKFTLFNPDGTINSENTINVDLEPGTTVYDTEFSGLKRSDLFYSAQTDIFYGSSVKTFTSTIKVNNPPIIEKLNKITVMEKDNVFILPNIIDPEGDHFTFTISGPVGDDKYWLTKPGDAGNYTINITADDGLLSSSTTVNLEVIPYFNFPPELIVDDVIEGTLEKDIFIPVSYYDKNNDPVTIWSQTNRMGQSSKGFYFDNYPPEPGNYTARIYFSDGTHELYKDIMIIASLCDQQWSCENWSDCHNGVRTRGCRKINECGTFDNRPIQREDCTHVCKEEWTCNTWSSCNNGEKTRVCTDNNKCGTQKDKPITTDACPICNSNLDCGTDGYFEDSYCSNNDIARVYRSYTCINPATTSSSCSPKYEGKVIEKCEGGCNNAKCNCVSNWSCSDWSCIDGNETRVCDDTQCNQASKNEQRSCGNTCTSSDVTVCSNGNVHTTDSCGNVLDVKKRCLNGCTAGKCIHDTICTQVITCDDWSDCVKGKQTRVCKNNCNSDTTTETRTDCIESKPDIYIKEIIPVDGIVIKHCNKGTADAKQMYSIRISANGITNELSFLTPAKIGECKPTYKLEMSAFGLEVNDAAIFRAVIDFDNVIDELDEGNNILIKDLTLLSSCSSHVNCNQWSKCNDGFKTRVCTDINRCPYLSVEPYTKHPCDKVCQDSDGGINPLMKGISTNNIFGFQYLPSKEDICLKDNQWTLPDRQNILVEYYCLDGFGTSSQIDCPNGCQDGACIGCTSNSSSNCDDGDVYWYDSCGFKQSIKQNCDGAGCFGNKCNECLPEWNCPDWGNCIDGKKTRICTDGCENDRSEKSDCGLLPDLMIKSVSLSPFTIEYCNIGEGDSESSIDISVHSNGVTLPFSGIVPKHGECTNINGTTSFIKPFTVTVDSGNVVNESNELNNIKIIESSCVPNWTCNNWSICHNGMKSRSCADGCNNVTLENIDCRKPDLVIKEVTVRPFSMVHCNEGSIGSDQPMGIHIYMENTTIILSDKVPKPGTCLTFTHPVSILEPIRVHIDPNGLIDESNETNNEGYFILQCSEGWECSDWEPCQMFKKKRICKPSCSGPRQRPIYEDTCVPKCSMNCDKDFIENNIMHTGGICTGDNICSYTKIVTTLPQTAIVKNLYPGLNLLSIPLNDNKFKHASDLIRETRSTFVARVVNNKFELYIPGLTPDFDLIPGIGYLVKVSTFSTLTIEGHPYDNIAYQLKKGLNIISLPFQQADFADTDDIASLFNASWVVTTQFNHGTKANEFTVHHPGFGFPRYVTPIDAYIIFVTEDNIKVVEPEIFNNILPPNSIAPNQGQYKPLKDFGITLNT